jgi:predicted phosphoribosyltransferase
MIENLIQLEKYRNRSHVFEDRQDAGRVLAGMLQPNYKGARDAVILAIPSGGVPVGIEAAADLDLPMDLIIVRKVRIPGNTEAGFGSVSSTGKMFFNEPLLNRLGLSQTEIDQQVDKVKSELAEREKRFRGGAPFPDLSGKTAIIADDGLASGFTMLAAVDSVRAKGAKRVIAAVPTAHPGSLDRVAKVCDEVYCANVREGMRFAVAEAYRNWRDLEPDEVEAMVRKAGIIK